MRTKRLFDFLDGAEGGDFFKSTMDLLFGLFAHRLNFSRMLQVCKFHEIVVSGILHAWLKP